MNILSNKILQITTVFMGPAAKVFLDRQTKYHMNGISLEEVTEDQLPELLHWIRVSGRLILKDKANLLVEELESKLNVKTR